jgi:hypothetical protein
MKYPLAVVQRLIDMYGSDICLGYDIMCAFIKTLSHSVLGSKKVAFRLHGVVPSFHGHAHNRGCQLQWHPMYTEGVGLEDFEECERTFGKSNELASVTRLASPYHRAQHIDEHFTFHDQDKHAASGAFSVKQSIYVMTYPTSLSQSGNFIFQNYRQALDKIEYESRQLAALAAELKTTDADYESYIKAERDHLQSLRSEPAEVQHAIDYVELLQKLQELKYVPWILEISIMVIIQPRSESDKAKVDFKNLDFNIINNGYTRKEIAAVRTRYRTTFTRWAAKEEELSRYEEEHAIDPRWLPDSDSYKATQKLLVERSYRRAVDNLERLIVQRLFELTKLGMNGVGKSMLYIFMLY